MGTRKPIGYTILCFECDGNDEIIIWKLSDAIDFIYKCTQWIFPSKIQMYEENWHTTKVVFLNNALGNKQQSNSMTAII